MSFLNIDDKIRKAFSDASTHYDVLTSLHKEIGRELIKKTLSKEPCEQILDVGMGTGWLTKRLVYYFPEAKVTGLDFSDGMVTTAKNVEDLRVVQAKAQYLPFKPESFDIVISNLAFQWVNHLNVAFKDTHRSLKKDGVFLFTMFGRQTCNELFISLDYAAQKKNKTLRMQRLMDKQQVLNLLTESGFKDIVMDYERIKVHFADVIGLIKWLKSIGANMLDRDGFVGRDLLSATEEYYHQNFRDHLGIITTFEVIWAQARK